MVPCPGPLPPSWPVPVVPYTAGLGGESQELPLMMNEQGLRTRGRLFQCGLAWND